MHGADDSRQSPPPTLRSRITTQGLDRTPHRAFLRGMGLADEDIGKPFIGVMSTHGEVTPCSMTLGPQAEQAKAGVAAAGGVGRLFTTISVSDGLSMNHLGMRFSLVSRELIADSIEAVVRGHCYDGLVGFGGCDKTLPAIMMAMVRCNVPSVFHVRRQRAAGALARPRRDGAGCLRRRGCRHDGPDDRGGTRRARARLPAVDRRPAPASSRRTRWRWCRRRSAWRCPARR